MTRGDTFMYIILFSETRQTDAVLGFGVMVCAVVWLCCFLFGVSPNAKAGLSMPYHALLACVTARRQPCMFAAVG